MSNTDENRFHALKFAAQTLGAAHPGEVIQAANLYLDFLEGRLQTADEPAPIEDVELCDLTESYPADEPVIAVADSPMEAEQIVDELFGTTPEPTAEAIAIVEMVEKARAEVAAFTQFAGIAEIRNGVPVFVSDDHAESLGFEVPTEAEITAAVEQIADPAPVTEDASEQPEMTDEQVERTEDHWRAAADQIGEAEHEPEKELEAAGAYMRFKPWFSRT